MTTIGNDIVPGPVTEVKTADFVGVSPESPQDVALAGPADFGDTAEQGSGEAETVYTIVSSSQARDVFGQDSALADNVALALGNGSKPVFAIAPAAQEASGESHGSNQSGTLDNTPVAERASEVTFTVDGTAFSTVKSLDPANEDLGTEEAAYNPASGEFQLSATPSTEVTATYTYYDYTNAFDEMQSKIGSTIDFLAPIQENVNANNEAQLTTGEMESQANFAIAIVGAGAKINPSEYTQSFDDSRVQMYYPTRDVDDNPVMGAIVGKRGDLGISTSPMRKSLSGVKRMSERLNLSNKSNLLDQKINPIDSRSGGAQIVDDVTTVSDQNSEEANMDTGFARLVIDAVTLTVIENEEPFIGTLNTESQRNSLEGVIDTQIGDLQRSQAVEFYDIDVTERDARSADVHVNVETVRGLRNIYNTISAGVREDSE